MTDYADCLFVLLVVRLLYTFHQVDLLPRDPGKRCPSKYLPFLLPVFAPLTSSSVTLDGATTLMSTANNESGKLQLSPT
jgi:hypothetical protein